MAARRKTRSHDLPKPTQAEAVLDANDTTLVDLLDRLLNKGVVLDADVVLGVAGVDLVYLRLAGLLSAVDRVLARGSTHPKSHRRHNRGPRPLRQP